MIQGEYHLLRTNQSVPFGTRPKAETDLSAFMILAKKRFQLASDAESEIRKDSLEDLNFRAGKQWPQQIESDRILASRPCLTINRLPQFISQVVNEERQNRPSIQINPVGDGADQETAEILQGIVRHIENISDAEIAYDTGFEYAVTMGFGYWRIITEYEDERSFDQEIKLKRVRNQFTIYMDPTANEPDKSDANWAFVVDDMIPDEYRYKYPNSSLAGLTEFTGVGDGTVDWFPDNKIRVAEYFFVEKEQHELCLLADGRRLFLDQVEEADKDSIIKRRTTEISVVKHCIINAVEIIHPKNGRPETWPGKFIPIIPVFGDELIVDGKQVLTGIVRYAKDPQRMYNYMRTAATELIALAPKAPFIGAEGQFEDHEDTWQQANNRNFAYLEYKPKSVDGVALPAPQRNTFEPPIQAITAALAQSDNDLKATTGIYDASLGAPGPERSGRAIMARQKEGDTANFNYIDNQSRAVKFTGKQLIDLIPKIYDRPGRVVRIISPDGTHRPVTMNQQFLKDGMAKIYDTSVGKYDVTISVGPSYTTKRQEAAASMIELTKNYPALMQVAGDLLVKNLDWPGALEIAARLKKMLPPQLQDSGPTDLPPEAQAKIDALMKQHDLLTQQLQHLTEVINTKQVENASKERIAAMQVQAQLIATEAKIRADSAEAMLKAELADINNKLDIWNDHLLADKDAQLQTQLAQMQNQGDQQQTQA